MMISGIFMAERVPQARPRIHRGPTQIMLTRAGIRSIEQDA